MGIGRNRDGKGMFITEHGYSKHPLYANWYDMMQRCYNPKGARYKDYGNRGIKVCNRWHDVKMFCDDLGGQYRDGYTIDRIDVNGNYTKDNVRLVHQKENSRYTRRTKINYNIAQEIRERLKNRITQRTLAEQMNLPRYIIADVSANRVWTKEVYK